MAAYEIPGLQFSAEAGGAIAIRRFVKFDANENVVQAGAGEAALGVSMNDADTGEVVDISDGIVIVEAGGPINPNDAVECDANGRAIVRSTGITIGVALTGAAAAGELVTIKTPAVVTLANFFTINYQVEDLNADADIANRPIFVVPTGKKFTITDVQIISQGAPTGIDDANTCVVALENGGVSIVSKTYNSTNVFPNETADSLGTISNAELSAGDILDLSVTNGTAADTPAFIVQIIGTLQNA
jgi:hypothetical protein